MKIHKMAIVNGLFDRNLNIFLETVSLPRNKILFNQCWHDKFGIPHNVIDMTDSHLCLSIYLTWNSFCPRGMETGAVYTKRIPATMPMEYYGNILMVMLYEAERRTMADENLNRVIKEIRAKIQEVVEAS